MMTYAIRYGRAKLGEEPPILEAHFIPSERAVPLYMDADYPGPAYYITSVECECKRPEMARQRMERILGQAGMPTECYHFALSDFEALPHARLAWQYASAFVEQDTLWGDDGTKRTGLLLSGRPGTGKTTLGSVVFRLRVEAGQAGCWCKYTDILSKVRATYQDGYSGPSVNDIRDMLTYARFLMIDDLGSATRTTTYAEDMVEFMFLVVDHRLAKGLPTLITSNLTGDQIDEQFGAPVGSRLRGLCHVIIMDGSDFRRKTSARATDGSLAREAGR